MMMMMMIIMIMIMIMIPLNGRSCSTDQCWVVMQSQICIAKPVYVNMFLAAAGFISLSERMSRSDVP